MDPTRIAALDDVALLAEPVRRALYEFVTAQREPVGRDAAAEAVGVGRPLAVFHLDKLVEAGLLEVSFKRLSGRTGPGAGRPAKLYGRAPRDLAVSIPDRRYEVAARLFAAALAAGAMGEASTDEALDAAARRYGRSLGEAARRQAGTRPSRGRLVDAAIAVLETAGFEPLAGVDDVIVLRNCPFDALARTYRDLTCGMNRSLMSGVLDGLRLAGVRAELDPQPGMCCVVWREAPAG